MPISLNFSFQALSEAPTNATSSPAPVAPTWCSSHTTTFPSIPRCCVVYGAFLGVQQALRERHHLRCWQCLLKLHPTSRSSHRSNGDVWYTVWLRRLNFWRQDVKFVCLLPCSCSYQPNNITCHLMAHAASSMIFQNNWAIHTSVAPLIQKSNIIVSKLANTAQLIFPGSTRCHDVAWEWSWGTRHWRVSSGA